MLAAATTMEASSQINRRFHCIHLLPSCGLRFHFKPLTGSLSFSPRAAAPSRRFMACSMGAIMLQSIISHVEDECLEKTCVPLKICAQMWRCNLKLGSCGRISSGTRQRLTIAFALDTGGIPENGSQDNLDGDETGLGRTRLGRIVRAGGKQLLEKLNAARRNFPMKIFLLLLGFYTANALATILGQTGDWDVLVAGVVVAAIEGIGMLMYRKPMSKSNGRLRNLVGMVNYWKAGVCLGLFVDAFKLGS